MGGHLLPYVLHRALYSMEHLLVMPGTKDINFSLSLRLDVFSPCPFLVEQAPLEDQGPVGFITVLQGTMEMFD